MEIFSGFIDLSSVVAVFVPLLLTCVSLWFACKTKWNVLFRDLGVPLGLFFSVLGATAGLGPLQNGDEVLLNEKKTHLFLFRSVKIYLQAF